MTSRLEPGDQIPHLTSPLQGETQHRVRLEPVHVSPQFLIGHPNLVGFADCLIQTLFGEPQLPFEELQRLRFLIEPDLSPAQRFGDFIRIGPGLPQSVELQPVASPSVRLELVRVFPSIRRGRSSPTDGIVEALGQMGNHGRNVMDEGFFEDTDSLNRVPIQAAGLNGSFQVTKVGPGVAKLS